MVVTTNPCEHHVMCCAYGDQSTVPVFDTLRRLSESYFSTLHSHAKLVLQTSGALTKRLQHAETDCLWKEPVINTAGMAPVQQ